jgi:chromosomal replication initiation ATPase DnaA
VREARGREDFLVAPANAAAVAALEAWRGWPDGRFVLTGPEGSGKTHLAHVWAAAAGARLAGPAALAADAVPALAAAPLALDDADGLAGDAAAETALLHCLNLAAAGGHPVLLTGRTRPEAWGLGLADLASRIGAAPRARLEPPDDNLLAAVMLKLCADRQIHVPPAVVLWLLPRMTRSLAFARRLVAALDARALAERRPVSRGMARAVLEGLAETEG